MTNKVILTVAVPESDLAGANHLAACLGWLEGWPPSEWFAAFRAQYRDTDGNQYRVMSCLVGNTFLENAAMLGPVNRPIADTENLINLTSARLVQSKIVAWTGVGVVPRATADRVISVAGMDGVAALSAMGLTPVQDAV